MQEIIGNFSDKKLQVFAEQSDNINNLQNASDMRQAYSLLFRKFTKRRKETEAKKKYEVIPSMTNFQQLVIGKKIEKIKRACDSFDPFILKEAGQE